MFTFLKYLLRTANPQPTGALLDTRPPEQKTNDIHFSEIVASANAVNWITKDSTTWRTFPALNQYQTFMCGANSLSKAWGIYLSQKYGKYVQLSRGHIYQRRKNRPGAGMALYDMFDILKQGATLEQLTGENIQSDDQADSLVVDQLEVAVGQGFATTGGVFLPSDIDTIASVIQTTGKGVILTTYFTAGEWSKTFPTIVNTNLGSQDPSALRHFVVAVDFTLYNNQKCLIIEDSAWFGGINRRIISEDWVTRRVVATGYLMTFKYAPQPTKPTYDGISIISAQKCLQADGDFPTNISFIENLGPITRQSLVKFQVKYGLPQTGALDIATQSKLHQVFP